MRKGKKSQRIIVLLPKIKFLYSFIVGINSSRKPLEVFSSIV